MFTVLDWLSGIIGYYYFVAELFGMVQLFTVGCFYFKNYTTYLIVKNILKINK